MTDHTESNGSLGPEVPEKAGRRWFEAAYKLRILAEAERCIAPGQLGELLRREGLYSSHLTSWRKQHERGDREGRDQHAGVRFEPKRHADKQQHHARVQRVAHDGVRAGVHHHVLPLLLVLDHGYGKRVLPERKRDDPVTGQDEPHAERQRQQTRLFENVQLEHVVRNEDQQREIRDPEQQHDEAIRAGLAALDDALESLVEQFLPIAEHGQHHPHGGGDDHAQKHPGPPPVSGAQDHKERRPIDDDGEKHGKDQFAEKHGRVARARNLSYCESHVHVAVAFS